jgi:hypothetical protein
MVDAVAGAAFVFGLVAISAGAWLLAPWVGLVVGGAFVALTALGFLAMDRLRSSFVSEADEIAWLTDLDIGAFMRRGVISPLDP